MLCDNLRGSLSVWIYGARFGFGVVYGGCGFGLVIENGNVCGRVGGVSFSVGYGGICIVINLYSWK